MRADARRRDRDSAPAGQAPQGRDGRGDHPRGGRADHRGRRAADVAHRRGGPRRRRPGDRLPPLADTLGADRGGGAGGGRGPAHAAVRAPRTPTSGTRPSSSIGCSSIRRSGRSCREIVRGVLADPPELDFRAIAPRRASWRGYTASVRRSRASTTGLDPCSASTSSSARRSPSWSPSAAHDRAGR